MTDLARRGQFDSVVVANIPLCREHYRLVLRVDAFPPTTPGQFVQVACADDPATLGDCEREWDESRWPRVEGTELSSRQAVLRRPFSLAGRRDTRGGVEIELIHRVVGVGTDWLRKLQVGDNVGLIGPLGNSFTLPDTDTEALLVGGGVGIPPMIYLASQLAGRRTTAFCGALTKDLLALTLTQDAPDAVAGQMNVTEFARHDVPTVISTDDGSVGYRGFVTQAFERYLDQVRPAKAIIYTCGPEPMMRRVADIAAARGIPTQIAVERAMACGMGTCQSCVIKVKAPTVADSTSRDAWRFKLACTDGPVFAGTDLLW